MQKVKQEVPLPKKKKSCVVLIGRGDTGLNGVKYIPRCRLCQVPNTPHTVTPEASVGAGFADLRRPLDICVGGISWDSMFCRRLPGNMLRIKMQESSRCLGSDAPWGTPV